MWSSYYNDKENNKIIGCRKRNPIHHQFIVHNIIILRKHMDFFLFCMTFFASESYTQFNSITIFPVIGNGENS